MATAEIGLFKFLNLAICVAVIVLGALGSAESIILVQFHKAPPEHSRFSTAVFRYSVERPDGSNACEQNGCAISCELDGQSLRSCPADNIVLKNLTVNQKHSFLLNVTTRSGERNSSFYSWFIDTEPPTAAIFSEQNYTNAAKVTIDITFSEACTGLGGFKCMNSSDCDVISDGPAYVDPSSLRIIKPDVKYRLEVVIPLKELYGRIAVSMTDKFCTDKAGNYFKRENNSIMIIHFDRRPVHVDLWMPVPSYLLEINGVPRTVLSTNKVEDLRIFLDFSILIRNSTEEVFNALHVNSGDVFPVPGGNHGNRKFIFEIKNVSSTKIITVELEAGSLIGMTGSPVSPVASLAILYDSMKPDVALSTSSPIMTMASNINVIVEFTKPMFGFEASMVELEGGKLVRFKELSRALYSLTVLVVAQNTVTITVPAGKVNDISGNQNLASNQLEVKHYSTPAISMALHSFITAGVLATSLAAAALSLSCANLGAIGALALGNTYTLASDPSTNLHGLFGHLQVFVLSDWLSKNHPIEYSETTRGLQWLIPRQKLPWKSDGTLSWPNNVQMAEGYQRISPSGFVIQNISNTSFVRRQSPSLSTEIYHKFGWLQKRNVTMESTPYGLPLNSQEYFIYFLRGEPLSASNVVKKLENYKGWQDLEMNLFWLAVGGGCLLAVHILILLFLRWRTGTPAHGILSVPSFELLLLILTLPCISQSATFVIRSGTIRGIIIGALLLVIPAAFILSVCLFLVIAIFSGSFAQYKEIREVITGQSWYTKLWFFFIGSPVTGKWFYREGLPSSFLPRFAILFGDRKGPTLFVYAEQNDPNSIPKWIGSAQSGIGRMRAISSDDSNEEIKVPTSRRLLGCARSSYIIIDLLRRVSLGIMSGSFTSQESSRSLFALSITLIQLVYLLAFKPYIKRGVQLVESISLLCEAVIFGLSLTTPKNSSNPIKPRTLGYTMLALLFISFLSQIINEWYALMKCLLRVSQPEKNSFANGLKFAAKGLVLPFLPRKHWSRVMPSSSQLKTGLSPVPPSSPETTTRERRERRGAHIDPFSAMTATVVPVLSPGSPGLNVVQMSAAAAETAPTRHTAGEGKRPKGLKYEQKSEMKKLRKLAKASFTGESKGVGDGIGTSYASRQQLFSPETSFCVQASTSNSTH